jgi:hypothetical protein
MREGSATTQSVGVTPALGCVLLPIALLACSSQDAGAGAPLPASADAAVADHASPPADAGADTSPIVSHDGAAADGMAAGPDATAGDGAAGGPDATPDDGAAGPDAPGDDGGSVYPAPHPAVYPQIPSFGTTMSAPTLVSILAANDALATQLADFGDAVFGSAFWDVVSQEYHVAPGTSVHLSGPAITSNMKLTDMQSYVAQAVSASGMSFPSGETIYLLYLPDGSSFVDDQTGTVNDQCQLSAGAHSAYGASGDALAWVQRCPPSYFGLASQQDAMTALASHEIAESATDPTGDGYVFRAAKPVWSGSVYPAWNGSSWFENGDLCESNQVRIGAFAYQQIWSNSAAAAGDRDPCAPAMPSPYYATTPAHDWYSVPANGSTTITLTSWSTGPVPDWIVGYPAPVTSGGFTFVVSTTTTETLNGTTYYTTNNGRSVTLKVTAKGAQSGSWGTLEVLSHQRPFGTWSVGDRVSGSYVGVYVP